MKIELKKLMIENFKSIRKKEVSFYHVTTISGENESGKTTLYDAYYWLLFDKDSGGRANFKIKPIDPKTGEDSHNLTTSVEGTFSIDGEELVLKKELSEKWTRKRGSAIKTYQGNTCAYYWQGVPVTMKDYREKLKQILGEEESGLKLLSNPQYFNRTMDDKERREVVISLAGEPTPEEVFQADLKLKELADDLKEHSIDDLLAIEKNHAKKTNEKLKELPARIDELYGLIEEKDFPALKKEKAEKERAIQLLSEREPSAKGSLEEIKLYRKSIAKLESQIQAKEREAEEAKEDQLKIQKDKIRALEDADEAKKREIEAAERESKRLNDKKEAAQQSLEETRKGWETTYKKRWKGDTACPTCGQILPKDKIQASIEAFNQKKEEELKELERKGKTLADDIKQLDEKVGELSEKLAHLSEEEKSLKCQVTDENEKLTSLKEAKEPEDKDLTAYRQSLAEYEEKLHALAKEEEKQKEEETEAEKQKQKEIQRLKEELASLEKELAQEATNETAKRNIAKLENEETALGKEYESIQRRLNLCEIYSRTRMDLVGKAIDSKFQLVQWKLFERQVNGGIKDVCVATLDGVPYDDVNSGGKILMGIDIINTLSQKKEKWLPIWIDNAESVTNYRGLKLDSQMIQMKAVEEKELEIKEA